MSIISAKTLLCAILAMLVALSSVTSAVAMAPDRDAVAYETLEALLGAVDSDLCGDKRVHDHHCPFCHGLPEAPMIGRAGRTFMLTPHGGWRQQCDLYRAAQSRDLNHSPRAPPVRA